KRDAMRDDGQPERLELRKQTGQGARVDVLGDDLDEPQAAGVCELRNEAGDLRAPADAEPELDTTGHPPHPPPHPPPQPPPPPEPGRGRPRVSARPGSALHRTVAP